MNFAIRLLIWLKGRYVGKDYFNNRYYEERPKKNSKRLRRWVIYAKNHDEASKITPEWHAWLHYKAHSPLDFSDESNYDWQTPRQPNLTGTKDAYRPESTKDGKVIRLNTKTKRPYESWKPDA